MKKGAVEDGCTQPEAFCLMQYECNSYHLVLVWNSRDGVIPYGISCPAGGCPLTSRHIHFGHDVYEPSHEPKTGDYVFVDLTLELARASRLVYVEKCWDLQMKEMFRTKKEAIERLASGDMKSFEPHTPHLTRWE